MVIPAQDPTVAAAIDVIDRQVEIAPESIRDAQRIVRAWLRRPIKRNSSVDNIIAAVPLEDEPITAKQRFLRAAEELKKGSEPPGDR